MFSLFLRSRNQPARISQPLLLQQPHFFRRKTFIPGNTSQLQHKRMAPSRHKRIPGIKIIQENLHKAIPRFGSNARRTSLAHRLRGTLPFRLQQPVHLLPPRKHPGTGIIVRLGIIRSVARPSQIAARHIARMPQHPFQLTGNDRISHRILPGILGIDTYNQLQPFTRDTDKAPTT